MHPNPIPTEAGCLVRLVTRGERQAPTHSTITGEFGSIPLITIGTNKPDIYEATVWHGGAVYRNRDIRCDMIGTPPDLLVLLNHLAIHHDHWALIKDAA